MAIDRNSRRARTLLFVLGGIAALVVAGTIGFFHAEQAMSASAKETIDYVRRQSLVYDSYNDATVTKSLMRAIENAGQVSRDLAGAPTPAEDGLERIAGELRVTGIAVLDATGAVEASYYRDEADADILPGLEHEALLDCADHPKKVYSERIDLADGSTVDVGATHREDAPGVVVVLYKTAAAYAKTFRLDMQDMLRGFGASSAAVVIEQGGKAIAANDEAMGTDRSVSFDESAIDYGVIGAIKDEPGADKFVCVRQDGRDYFGMMSRVSDYYVYVYEPATKVFSETASIVAVAALAYGAFAAVASALMNRDDHRRLEERLAEERAHRESLSAAVEQARAADRAKTDFLRRMSHDIRTPINGIVGMVAVADTRPDDLEMQAACREKIKGAAGMLTALVGEVLDMSKLEGGVITLDEQPFNLMDLRDQVMATVAGLADEHGVKLERHDGTIEHGYLVGSPAHVKRILLSVLGNAVKYNHEGGFVTLTCSEVGFDGERAVFRFVCSDTGIGMSPVFLERVFEPFAREHESAGFEDSSTGLGLAIAYRLVTMMDGSISAESEEGVGSTFTIELPFKVAPDGGAAVPADAADSDSTPAEQLKGMNILLVEDNDLNAEVAAYLLRDQGVNVIRAHDGADALAMFDAAQPGAFDAVLMDVMMPVMDGYQASRAIRALDRPDSGLPIIGMSANAFADDIRRAREAGMDDYLPKPIDGVLLAKTLVRACANAQE